MKSKRSDDSHSSAKLQQQQQQIVSVMSLEYTQVTKQRTVLDLFNVCSNHAPFNYSGQES